MYLIYLEEMDNLFILLSIYRKNILAFKLAFLFYLMKSEKHVYGIKIYHVWGHTISVTGRVYSFFMARVLQFLIQVL